MHPFVNNNHARASHSAFHPVPKINPSFPYIQTNKNSYPTHQPHVNYQKTLPQSARYAYANGSGMHQPIIANRGQQQSYERRINNARAVQTPHFQPVHNRKLAFINTTPIPLSQPVYDNVHSAISHLIEMGNVQAARSFALNAFDDYHFQVFKYIYKIKQRSVELTNHIKKIQPFVAATVVFDIFDTAQDKIINFHENSIRQFQQFDDDTFRKNPNRNFQNEHTVLVQLKRRLKQYEDKVRKVEGIFRQSLGQVWSVMEN